MTQRSSLLGKNAWTIRAAFILIVIFAIQWSIALYGQTVPGHFIDATQKLGVQFRQQASPTAKKYLLETMGSGAALFDYDNDGVSTSFLPMARPSTIRHQKAPSPRRLGRNIGTACTIKSPMERSRTSRKRPASPELDIPLALPWATTTTTDLRICTSPATGEAPYITTMETGRSQM
jgi:hypothetical protein